LVLEQVMVQLFGDQQVYRGGMKITTSLDKALQEDINRLEDAGLSRSSVPETVTVISQGGQARAILCSPGKDEQIRERMAYHAVDDYEIKSLSRDSITRDMIVTSVEGEKQQGAKKRAAN
jgi:hypothetical protein